MLSGKDGLLHGLVKVDRKVRDGGEEMGIEHWERLQWGKAISDVCE